MNTTIHYSGVFPVISASIACLDHSAFGFPESTTNPPFIEDDGGSRSNPGQSIEDRPSWSTRSLIHRLEFGVLGLGQTIPKKQTMYRFAMTTWMNMHQIQPPHKSPILPSQSLHVQCLGSRIPH